MKGLDALNMATRFNLLNVALVIATALSIGFIVTYQLLTAQFTARTQYNHAIVDLLAESSEYAVYTRQYELLEKQLARLSMLPGLATLTISDVNGTVLAQITPRLPETNTSLSFWQWWHDSGGQVVTEIARPIVSSHWQNEDALFFAGQHSDRTIGQVRLAMDPAYFETILRETFLLSFAVVIVILLISLVIFIMLTARITRPLQQLSVAAHDVAEGRLTPVRLRSGGPELRELGHAFNLMIEWLSDYRREVENYQDLLERQAYYDELTGLANRTLLKETMRLALAQAQRHRTSVAVLFLDLDRFKYINDTLGHSCGDQLLQDVSRRLHQQVRGNDTVGRMGGDEFIIILNDLADDYERAKHDAGQVAYDIGRALCEPFPIGNHTIMTSFSIGIALYPHDGENGEVLIRNADCAMYEAKTRGRNTYHFYEPTLEQRGMRRLNLEIGLKQALEREELQLYFQPQFDARRQRLTGAEALLRWRYQDTWISPLEFIPLAEETQLILPIGDWVLETALAALAAWRRQNLVADDFHIGVNVSPIQFWHPQFATRLLAILDRRLPSPETLELELTESCLLRPSDEILRTFGALRDTGLRFAIDDFGTGYSSLSYLKQFPLDVLKIDQSFVRDCIDDPSDATIIYAIIAMAKGLGLSVIAEGVETAAQAQFLDQAGCHAWQGYWLAKPMPADEFVAFCQRFVPPKFV